MPASTLAAALLSSGPLNGSTGLFTEGPVDSDPRIPPLRSACVPISQRHEMSEPDPTMIRFLTWLTVVLVALTTWEVTYPLNFQAQVQSHWLAGMDIHKIDDVGNVLLFIPWSLVAAWRLTVKGRSRLSTVLQLTLLGMGLSFAAETLQVWLPDRDSSLLDVITNTLGAMLGAWFGCAFSGWLSRRLRRGLDALRRWPATRRLAWCLLAVLAVRAAPFDIAPQTWELQQALRRTSEAGLPFHATIGFLRGGAGGQALRKQMLGEVGWGALSLILFAATAVLMARAVRERFLTRGDRTSPVLFVLPMGGALVLVTAAMGWPIRSRTVDATDAVAGLIGLVVGIGIDQLWDGWQRLRGGRRVG
jgi:VanZ family protein